MNQFDTLTLGFAVLAMVALYQLRPCTLILCGNCLLVARALSSIERSGPPVSQAFLPAYVFSTDNLLTAALILTYALVVILAFTLGSIRHRIRIGPDAPPVPRPILFVIGLYLVAYVGSTSTIFTTGYASQADIRYDLELSGAHALLCSLIVYELARRRLLATITAVRSFLLVLFIFALAHYSKGSTGITTGYLVTAAVLLLPRTGASKRLANVMRIGAAMLLIVLLSYTVRSIRTSFHTMGSDALESLYESTFEKDQTYEDSDEGIEYATNASQSATHMLLCATLYDLGRSREWRSIYDVVEYTFVPSFFMRWFGWTRSIDAPSDLRMYGFEHGGGINVLGEFYWNGGWLCVLVMVLALVFFCFVVDRRYRASPFWLMMLAQFAPSFLMGCGYGFAQVSRGAINGLLVAATYQVFRMLRGAPPISHSSQASVPAAPQFTT